MKTEGTALAALGVAEAARGIRDGAFRSEDLTRSCLDRIAAREPEVRAWAAVDPDLALEQARAQDLAKTEGRWMGPLHGVPIGVKDIIDTRGLPTECGTPILAGRRPNRDAALVTSLREAGAVILGKTVTAELATLQPGETRNPRDPARTPGGSSSGSAAAVADAMVPGSIGTQTNGSVIRPAAFCGVFGFKPSFGMIPRTGVLTQSPDLDTVGVFGVSVADLACLAEPLMRQDPGDPSSRADARRSLSAIATAEAPVPPRLAFVPSPVWERADPSTREAFEELAEALGERVTRLELPRGFERAVEAHRTIMLADIAAHYAPYAENGWDQLSPVLRGMIEEGRSTPATAYIQARGLRAAMTRGFDEVFEEFDAILTPATVGEAPVGLETTGDPVFCTLWTLCGLPAVTLPLMQGPAGMPLGVQLVGANGDDARLLRTARWLVETLRAELGAEDAAA